MHNNLKTIETVFYWCAGVFLVLGLVIIFNLDNLISVSLSRYPFAHFCIIVYTLAVPGIFLCLGIAMNKINHALFDETLSRIKQDTKTNK